MPKVVPKLDPYLNPFPGLHQSAAVILDAAPTNWTLLIRKARARGFALLMIGGPKPVRSLKPVWQNRVPKSFRALGSSVMTGNLDFDGKGRLVAKIPKTDAP